NGLTNPIITSLLSDPTRPLQPHKINENPTKTTQPHTKCQKSGLNLLTPGVVALGEPGLEGFLGPARAAHTAQLVEAAQR
ncbi:MULTISPECIES: hypothetical protein, partial [Actinomyces]|uniref:hypothetical protein n=1 Tax=Actinomyces TaxID=1654 RepID=UPI001A7EF81B